jgi:phosphoribosylcarboxyaminoimidazole (NCAIR) mutase
LAAQILGVTNEAIASEVISFKNEMNQEVLNKATSVEEIGYQQYLNNQK